MLLFPLHYNILTSNPLFWLGCALWYLASKGTCRFSDLDLMKQRQWHCQTRTILIARNNGKLTHFMNGRFFWTNDLRIFLFYSIKQRLFRLNLTETRTTKQLLIQFVSPFRNLPGDSSISNYKSTCVILPASSTFNSSAIHRRVWKPDIDMARYYKRCSIHKGWR